MFFFIKKKKRKKNKSRFDNKNEIKIGFFYFLKKIWFKIWFKKQKKEIILKKWLINFENKKKI